MPEITNVGADQIMTPGDALAIVAGARNRDLVEKLEGVMLEMPQSEAPVKHYFCNGSYLREVTLPAGSLAIGHAHAEDCLNIVVSGRVSVVVDGVAREMKAGDVFVGKALDRKVGYIHEESRWQTVHATTETNPDVLEELLLVKSATWLAHEQAILQDREDYNTLVEELGFTKEEVREVVEQTYDVISYGCDSLRVAPSQREGLGVFARIGFGPGDVIAVSRYQDNRTEAGRYTNHSRNPNAAMVMNDDGNIYLVATRDIVAGCEVLVDYRQARATALQTTPSTPCLQSQ